MSSDRRPSSWKPLPNGVQWISEPVGCFKRSRAWMMERFGAPQGLDVDSNGTGLFDAWALRFDCGLEVALWRFHDSSGIEVYATDLDVSHILNHIGIDPASFTRWIQEPESVRSAQWRVLRQDDNGNEFVVATASSQCEAERIVRRFEAKGHKQTYWASKERRKHCKGATERTT